MSTIVVGIDGSDSSRQALAWAMGLAVRTGRPLRVVAALVLPRDVAPWGPWARLGSFEESEVAAARDEVRAVVDEVAARCSPRFDGDVDLRVRVGPPADVVLDDTGPDDHVVLGSSGVGHVVRRVLGSVSGEVIGRASCPVTVVPAPAS
jgi:nucleotide-binding universal stress UspA family protein